MPTETESKKAYNLKVTPLNRVSYGTMATGTKKLKFRAIVTLASGKSFERTVVAMGKAHDALKGHVKKGQEMTLRAFFEHAPANDDGARGGEYVSAIGFPQPKAA